jgi:hypothetical protein
METWVQCCWCCDKALGDGVVALALVNTRNGTIYCVDCKECALKDEAEHVAAQLEEINMEVD